MNFEADLAGQSKVLAALFAKELGQSEDQYMEGQLPLISQRVQLRQDERLIIVESRIPAPKLLEIVGATINAGDPRYFQDLKPKTDKPYTAVVRVDVNDIGMTVIDARSRLPSSRRGGRFQEGLAIILLAPDLINENLAIACIGTKISPSDRTPGLGMYEGKIIATYYLNEYSYVSKDASLAKKRGVVPLTVRR